jgi:hypothetical protein
VRTIARRLQKLEEGFGLGPESEQLLMVVTAADRGLALDQDRCIQILRESGSLPTGPVGVVNLGDIPQGLNAEELERFLRKKMVRRLAVSVPEHMRAPGRTIVPNRNLARRLERLEAELAPPSDKPALTILVTSPGKPDWTIEVRGTEPADRRRRWQRR